MSEVIWKQELEITESQCLWLPRGAKILTVQMQHDKPCIWFTCDPKESMKVQTIFYFFGTGHTLPDHNGKYIGTIQLHNGDLAFHLFQG